MKIKYPKRMLKLASILLKDARKKKGLKFAFTTWGSVEHDYDDNFNIVIEKPGMNCNTQACAMGAAALSGAFKREGLDYFMENSYIRFKWKGRRIDGVDAATRLFGIDYEDARYLFMSQKLPTSSKGAPAERHVANSLKKFVKENA